MAHNDTTHFHTEQAPIYTFLDVNFAGDTFTQLLGINDFNEIAGYHNQAVNQGSSCKSGIHPNAPKYFHD